VHGEISKAVYAYPSEHLPYWQTVRAQAGVAALSVAIAPGLLGENLLLEGLRETELWIGDRLWIGRGDDTAPGCVLAVSEPRMPWARVAANSSYSQP
jgi:MOSC domain-containing protein YiiM